jgi:hypothetical protein
MLMARWLGLAEAVNLASRQGFEIKSSLFSCVYSVPLDVSTSALICMHDLSLLLELGPATGWVAGGGPVTRSFLPSVLSTKFLENHRLEIIDQSISPLVPESEDGRES